MLKMPDKITHLHEALRADVISAERHGTGIPRIAAEIGVSESAVYQMLRGDLAFPSARLREHVEITGGRHVVELLAKWAGLGVFKIFPAEADNHALAESIARFSEMAQSVVMARDPESPGGVRLTRAEAQQIADAGATAIAAIKALCVSVETESKREFAYQEKF